MAYKEFNLEKIGPVRLYKRKGNRELKLTVNAVGTVRASMPTWMPYTAGWNFVKSQADWIQAQQSNRKKLLIHGQQVGKAHHLKFSPANEATQITTRIIGSEIIIYYPELLKPADNAVQTKAAEACVRALRRQANQLLPQRLQAHATTHNIEYTAVSIKRLKSRWGSCDAKKNIVLNLYLMQLPWDLIDYVLLHELAHTRVLRHGPPFWDEMRRLNPDSDRLRKAIRSYQPTLANPLAAVA